MRTVEPVSQLFQKINTSSVGYVAKTSLKLKFTTNIINEKK